MNANQNVTLTIDGSPVTVERGTTILSAAARAGITIPALCSYPGIEPPTSCFVCVVRIAGRKGLVPSCVVVAENGMEVESTGEEIFAYRKRALELLLSEHAGDCEAPCRRICPCAMDIPGMIRRVAEGDLDGAVAQIKQNMPFPALLGYICPAPCEKGCRRAKVDTAISIRTLHRDVALRDLAREQPWMPTITQPSGKKVTIVGAGPAGMSAAWYLSVAGHRCTVVEQRDRAGGLLAEGVAGDRLPFEVYDKEIGLLEKLGVAFAFNTVVEDLEEHEKQCDAIILATGENDPSAFGVKTGPRGILVEDGTFVTSRPRVFACGAAVTPGKRAVRSIGRGRDTALVVDRVLRENGPPRPTPRRFDSRLGKLGEGEPAAFVAASVAERGRVTDEAGTEELTTEAGRCLSCDCSAKEHCELRKYADDFSADQNQYRTGERRGIAIDLRQGSFVYESGKCILCGRCVGITGERASGLSFVQRGFQTSVAGPLGTGMGEAMGDLTDRCITACPTAALTKRLGRFRAERETEPGASDE